MVTIARLEELTAANLAKQAAAQPIAQIGAWADGLRPAWALAELNSFNPMPQMIKDITEIQAGLTWNAPIKAAIADLAVVAGCNWKSTMQDTIEALSFKRTMQDALAALSVIGQFPLSERRPAHRPAPKPEPEPPAKPVVVVEITSQISLEIIEAELREGRLSPAALNELLNRHKSQALAALPGEIVLVAEAYMDYGHKKESQETFLEYVSRKLKINISLSTLKRWLTDYEEATGVSIRPGRGRRKYFGKKMS